ncbi:type VI secretion system baseplate subunit TssF [Escherichia coli]
MNGLKNYKSHQFHPVYLDNTPVSARGIDIKVILSKDAYMHPECFLFCSFFSIYFLGLHAPVNSFTRMITVFEHDETLVAYGR